MAAKKACSYHCLHFLKYKLSQQEVKELKLALKKQTSLLEGVRTEAGPELLLDLQPASSPDQGKLHSELLLAKESLAHTEATARETEERLNGIITRLLDTVEAAQNERKLVEDKLTKVVTGLGVKLSPALLEEIQGPDTECPQLLKLAQKFCRLDERTRRLSTDKAKLVQILAAVKGFKEFVEFSGETGDLSFLSSSFYTKQVKAVPVKGEWIPEHVYDILQTVKSYKKVSKDTLSHLLQQLQQAWLEWKTQVLTYVEKKQANRLTGVLQEQLPSIQEEFFTGVLDTIEDLTEEDRYVSRESLTKHLSPHLDFYTEKVLSFL